MKRLRLILDLENKIKTSKNSTGVIVDGIDNCAIKFAQCCNPLPGDEIVGFITRGHGISVHKKDCVNYLSQKDDPENAARWINVKWESSEKHTGYFKCTLDIVAVDRIGLLADVSSALAMINIFIYESTSRELKNGNAMLCDSRNCFVLECAFRNCQHCRNGTAQQCYKQASENKERYFC